MTCAPSATAICTAKKPTPPDARCTSTRSPSPTSSTSVSAWYAVSPASGSAPASAKRQRLRLVREAALRHGHELGRRPPLDVVPADVAEHLVAGREVDDGRADLLDDAGEVPARRDREVVREGAGQVAAADAEVDRVDAGGVRADQDDVRPDRRLGVVVDDPQDRLVAEPVVDGGSHRRPFT